MSAVLTQNAYGKSQIRLTKVTRHPDYHEIKELSVNIQLEGDFEASYTMGDNSRIIATDSMKNTVYLLAKDHPLTSIESFGQALADHLLEKYTHVSTAQIELSEQPWQRIVVNGREHPHAFAGAGNEKRTCSVTRTRTGLNIKSGLDDLLLLKTTDSAFAGFIRDRYTTLPETGDRILATILTANWTYGESSVDWNGCHQRIRQTVLEIFAQHKSLSVQETLYAMGEAALSACKQIEHISLIMQNKHRLLVNLQPFGLENKNEILVATEEPYGLITGTMSRR